MFGACFRACLGWFAFEPEWFDANNVNFAHSEARSVSLFVHYISNDGQSDARGKGHENGTYSVDMVRLLHLLHVESIAMHRSKTYFFHILILV
jgi:hypothetical protein